MTAMKKKRKKQEKVVLEFRTIPPNEWGKIFTIDWPPATREAIGLFYAYAGVGPAHKILQGTWSRAMQINRIMIKHGLPYRIREYELPPDEKPEITPYWIQGIGVKLCTVVKFL